MSFRCAWEDCDYESSIIKDYYYHVSEHVDYLWTEEWQSNKDSMSYLAFVLIIIKLILNKKQHFQNGIHVCGTIVHSNHIVR